MRVRSTDDGNDDIMDASEAIILAQDDELNQPFGEIDMTAKRKETAATDEAKATKKTKAKAETKAEAKPAKKEKKALPEGFGPRATPEGHTGLATLCEKLDIKPTAARRKLRGAEMGKPEGQHGWYWKDGSKDLAKVEKLLTAETAEA